MKNSINGRVKPGYGVASGKGGDRRYPQGTLRVQAPFFSNKGLDLSPYFMGTINFDISPCRFAIEHPKYFFESVNWSEHIPPENFYFFDLVFYYKGEEFNGLIYMPDPKTKVEHEQQNSTLELILPRIPDLGYGDEASIYVPDAQLKFYLE
ncbi:hypothetical protein [Poritiphilus flavus]|uniref:Uncharacterized protein n=1 Tax=Poritiphilus flavus TaxID=2697053 RepID=A0A6L9EF30_9FLAO|nr:hypothetical protein [Poritiphilus flavus]NAS13374.1 hypothetical protein [Poritiphilus flavus]